MLSDRKETSQHGTKSRQDQGLLCDGMGRVDGIGEGAGHGY